MKASSDRWTGRPFPSFARGLLPLLLLAGTVALVPPARGQATNADVFEELALRCLAEAPDTVRAFQLEAPARMPFVRTAVTARWRAADHRVYLADSLLRPPPSLPRLQYQIEEAGVQYERAGRGRLRRTIALGLRYTLLAPDGRLLREASCRETAAGVLRRADLARVETPAFPETQGVQPEGGWLRRYVEPALLGAATAIGVYLFFSLRNDRADAE